MLEYRIPRSLSCLHRNVALCFVLLCNIFSIFAFLLNRVRLCFVEAGEGNGERVPEDDEEAQGQDIGNGEYLITRSIRSSRKANTVRKRRGILFYSLVSCYCPFGKNKKHDHRL